jgi:hypothetical protein
VYSAVPLKTKAFSYSRKGDKSGVLQKIKMGQDVSQPSHQAEIDMAGANFVAAESRRARSSPPILSCFAPLRGDTLNSPTALLARYRTPIAADDHLKQE